MWSVLRLTDVVKDMPHILLSGRVHVYIAAMEVVRSHNFRYVLPMVSIYIYCSQDNYVCYIVCVCVCVCVCVHSCNPYPQG